MKQQISHWTTVLTIIEAGLERDVEKVRNYAELLADRLEEAGDASVAGRIRRVVKRTPTLPRTGSGSNSSMLMPSQLAYAPVDPESRSTFTDEIVPSADEPLVLPRAAAAEIDRLIRLYASADEFIRADIPVPRSVLLYGPPGCGKTSTARYIARALALPLLMVRLDAVMSSFLGTTAKNLRTVFEYAARRGAVLFLDEFDAVAKMRDDANEVGEIKRIVNSLIQNLDAFPQLYVIAATNHSHLLDPAIWRRFDAVIPLPLPGPDERIALLKLFLHTPDVNDNDLRWIATLSEGCSGADLEQVAVRARQEKVLNPAEPLIRLLSKEVWRRLEGEKLATDSQIDDRIALLQFIDSRTGGKMSARALEAFTGISNSTVGRIRRSQQEVTAHAG